MLHDTSFPCCEYQGFDHHRPGDSGWNPVFKGTRVPVKTLFEYIENKYTLAEFLECFPSVSREAARALLERSESVLLSVA
jgi:uncharacterized protein (DUF433 family)